MVMETRLLVQTIYLWIVILVWLSACVACDLRSRQVPAFLTIPPLVLAAVWQLIQGNWQIILLVLALILISDLPKTTWRISLASLGTLLSISITDQSVMVYAMLVMFGVWTLWEIGASGGADAKIIITLVLIFSNGFLIIPIVFAGGLQGLVALIAKRQSIPYTVSIATGTAVWMWLNF
jgi:Flp pilus assembly protein protease CpaA